MTRPAVAHVSVIVSVVANLQYNIPPSHNTAVLSACSAHPAIPRRRRILSVLAPFADAFVLVLFVSVPALDELALTSSVLDLFVSYLCVYCCC